MAQPNYSLGIKCRLFVNTGSAGSPTWTAVNNVSDFKITPKWDKAEGNTRGSLVKKVAKTLLGLDFGGKIKVDHTDANGYVAFLAAHVGATTLDVLALDGNPTDTTLTGTLSGYRFDAHVFLNDQDQALGNVVFDDLELAPALGGSVFAVSAAVTAGSPAYTYTAI